MPNFFTPSRKWTFSALLPMIDKVQLYRLLNGRKAMKSLRLAAGAALGALLVSAAVAAALGAAPVQDKPPKVAVVNLRNCFQQNGGYERVSDLNQDVKNRIQKNKGELEAIRQEMSSIQSKMEFTPPGTRLYGENRRKLLELQGRYKALEEVFKVELQELWRKYVNELYDEICAASAVIAKERGFDLVLKEDAPSPDETDEEKAKLASDNRIYTRALLYCGANLDITTTVIERLNAEYQKKKGQGAAPNPNPAPVNGK
jgi:Skp family chaperone for outer membrane proteins